MENKTISFAQVSNLQTFITTPPKAQTQSDFHHLGIFKEKALTTVLSIQINDPTSRADAKNHQQFKADKRQKPFKRKLLFKDEQTERHLKEVLFIGTDPQELQRSPNIDRNKYRRLSVNENQSEGKSQTSEAVSTLRQQKRNATMKIITHRTQTGNPNNNYQRLKSKSIKRRKCCISTKKQLEQEVIRYNIARQKEEIDQVFRVVNREMKASVKKREGNNYYQKLRKEALEKIEYMSYNQKYYDNAEVRHLNQIIKNCNILIHKRRQGTSKTNNSSSQRTLNGANRTQIVKKDAENMNIVQGSSRQLIFRPQINRNNKKLRLKTAKMQLQEKITNIVSNCQNEQTMLHEVKSGMKIFAYYCGKVEAGFALRSTRLANYLKSEEH